MGWRTAKPTYPPAGRYAPRALASNARAACRQIRDRRRAVRLLMLKIWMRIGVRLHVDQSGARHFHQLGPSQGIGRVRYGGGVYEQSDRQPVAQDPRIKVGVDRAMAIIRCDGLARTIGRGFTCAQCLDHRPQRHNACMRSEPAELLVQRRIRDRCRASRRTKTMIDKDRRTGWRLPDGSTRHSDKRCADRKRQCREL